MKVVCHKLWNIKQQDKDTILFFFKNGPSLASFLIYFCLFKQTFNNFLQQIYVKNVHPVSDAGIQTHNLWNMSLLP